MSKKMNITENMVDGFMGDFKTKKAPTQTKDNTISTYTEILSEEVEHNTKALSLSEIKNIRKNGNEKKTKRINLLVSQSVYDVIVDCAKKADENLNQFVTNSVLDRVIKEK